MSNNINLDNNVSGYNPVRTAGQNEVKKSSVEDVRPLEVTKTAGEDKLEFSNRGTEVGKLIEQVKSQPDIREDKVNALREQIAAGQYNPTSEQIASAIIKDENF